MQYYTIGRLTRASGNGTIVVYLSKEETPNTFNVFAGYTFDKNIALLLQKQVEQVDLYLTSDYPLSQRIQIPVDLLEYNERRLKEAAVI